MLKEILVPEITQKIQDKNKKAKTIIKKDKLSKISKLKQNRKYHYKQ